MSAHSILFNPPKAIDAPTSAPERPSGGVLASSMQDYARHRASRSPQPSAPPQPQASPSRAPSAPSRPSPQPDTLNRGAADMQRDHTSQPAIQDQMGSDIDPNPMQALLLKFLYLTRFGSF